MRRSLIGPLTVVLFVALSVSAAAQSTSTSTSTTVVNAPSSTTSTTLVPDVDLPEIWAEARCSGYNAVIFFESDPWFGEVVVEFGDEQLLLTPVGTEVAGDFDRGQPLENDVWPTTLRITGHPTEAMDQTVTVESPSMVDPDCSISGAGDCADLEVRLTRMFGTLDPPREYETAAIEVVLAATEMGYAARNPSEAESCFDVAARVTLSLLDYAEGLPCSYSAEAFSRLFSSLQKPSPDHSATIDEAIAIANERAESALHNASFQDDPEVAAIYESEAADCRALADLLAVEAGATQLPFTGAGKEPVIFATIAAALVITGLTVL